MSYINNKPKHGQKRKIIEIIMDSGLEKNIDTELKETFREISN